MDAKPPVSVQIPARRQILWVLFQFLYAALPEELFFRGYVQGRVARLVETKARQNRSFARYFAIGLSAGIFGLSHVLVVGDLAAALTLLPGLIFAWAYATSKSLVGPVLLHGAANVGYALLVCGSELINHP
jgi:membrane protease YdiL (CAAX protease family)